MERNQHHVGFVGISLAASFFELEPSWTETDDVGHLHNGNVVFEVQLGSQILLRQGRQAYGTRPIHNLSTFSGCVVRKYCLHRDIVRHSEVIPPLPTSISRGPKFGFLPPPHPCPSCSLVTLPERSVFGCLDALYGGFDGATCLDRLSVTSYKGSSWLII
jgi:hypothetical protein